MTIYLYKKTKLMLSMTGHVMKVPNWQIYISSPIYRWRHSSHKECQHISCDASENRTHERKRRENVDHTTQVRY